MDSRMTGVNGPDSSAATVRLLRLIILAPTTAAVGTATPAESALFWPDYSDGSYYYRPQQPTMQRPNPRKRTISKSKKDVAQKETGAKPQGPLVIAISIEKQRVTIYDSNGVFAESPVSTGMRGHPTPMGVFSVIQKHKFHHSNIYSNAPMPYMQRITWSGVAMHAGVLPGYPASHGCIRMPMAFAVKMWNWTRLGARVIVTPGEMTPSNFSHPMLAAYKVPPQPAASIETPADAPIGIKADKGAPEVGSANAEPAVELRTTVGHGEVIPDSTTGNAPSRDEAAAPADKSGSTSAESPKESPKTERTRTDEAAVAKPAETAIAPAGVETKPVEAARKAEAGVTATTSTPPAAPDAKKDQTRLAEPVAAAKPEAPKRAGQIAVFISRKDSKLYVRQNFAPLFEIPVTIAPGDRPMGTHVFTAEVDKNDANAVRWSVVSLPVSIRSAERGHDDGRTSRRQRV